MLQLEQPCMNMNCQVPGFYPLPPLFSKSSQDGSYLLCDPAWLEMGWMKRQLSHVLPLQGFLLGWAEMELLARTALVTVPLLWNSQLPRVCCVSWGWVGLVASPGSWELRWAGAKSGCSSGSSAWNAFVRILGEHCHHHLFRMCCF